MGNEKTRVLIVDDEEPIRRLLSRMLEMNNHSCTMATDAAEARALLEKREFELIISDINMPGESGLDLVQFVLSEYQDIAAIMLTAVDDAMVAEKAIEVGVYDYIIKPFERNELIISVTNSLRRRELEITNRRYRQDLESMVAERTAKLREAMEGIIQAMSLAVESRDPYTAGHQQRVAELACAIVEEMGFSDEQIMGIRMAGVVHDLGKISIPAEILSKPSRLTDIEFSLIKTHPQSSYDILKGIEFPWPIAQVVLQHHERMDGSGYPQGLSGEGILMEARILAVADVVEAMSSHRPYRPALGIDKALEEIPQNKGILYDPEVVDACLRLFKEKDFNLN